MKYFQSNSKQELLDATSQICSVVNRVKGFELIPPTEEDIFEHNGMFTVSAEFLQGFYKFPMPHKFRMMFFEGEEIGL